jgi:hypothetical protein
MSRDDILFVLGLFWAANIFTWLMVKIWDRKK